MSTSFGLITIETLRSKFSEIYINGELTKKVIATNDIEGWAEIIDRLDPTGEAITHRVFGDITLVPISGIKNINTIVDKISIVSGNERKITLINTTQFTTNHIYIPLTIEEIKVLSLSSDLTSPCIMIEIHKLPVTIIGLNAELTPDLKKPT
jgi:hypothetical protein